MTRPFTLQPLLEIMQNRADEATRRLGKLIASEQDAKARLQMLEQYRAEYAEKMCEASALGLTPIALRNYQDFLSRIDQAITQQAAVVKHSEVQTAHGQQHWKSQNKQLKAIDTLAVRHEARERHLEGKQEQKLLDEYTTRKFSAPKEDESG